MRPDLTPAERVIADIARRQHGLVTRAQAARAGVTESELKHRVRVGSLIRVHHGVYRVGHRAPSIDATYLAAVLACGSGAALSGRAAGHHLGLLRKPEAAEVTSGRRHRVKGVETRHDRRFERCDWWVLRGIPVTTPARTLVDLAAVLPRAAVARACHEAGVKHRTTPRQVREVLARKPNSPGAAGLRAVMEGDERVTLSGLERAFLSLLKGNGLPLPETNRVAGGRRVDCRWPEHHLTVELDSYTFHNSRHAWEQDHERRRAARARGDRFRRYTWYDVVEKPGPTVRELRTLLAVATSPRSS